MTVLLALFGGTALLLYGIRLGGDSLQRAIGGRLRQLLTVMSRTRLAAVASGALVTAIIQSSAATTLMLIGFVSAGLMTFRQTLGIILGADIGTTLTVQLIAFRITDYALLLVGAGFLITFLARRSTPKDIGHAILGLGLMFLALKLILDGAASERAAMAERGLGMGARSPARCAVSFSETIRGGRTTVSEALSTRRRHRWLNEQPSSAQAYTLMTPPWATTSTSSPLGWAAAMRSTATRTRSLTTGSGSLSGGGQSWGARSQAT